MRWHTCAIGILDVHLTICSLYHMSLLLLYTTPASFPIVYYQTGQRASRHVAYFFGLQTHGDICRRPACSGSRYCRLELHQERHRNRRGKSARQHRFVPARDKRRERYVCLWDGDWGCVSFCCVYLGAFIFLVVIVIPARVRGC